MGSAGPVTASARGGDVGVGRVEAASCRAVEEVTFEEDFRAAIIEIAGTRTFDVDDGPHRGGRDANDTPSLIDCPLRQRLTWSGEIQDILPWAQNWAPSGQLRIRLADDPRAQT